MTFYDFAAPFYGIWAALLESKAHRLAADAVAAQTGRDLLEVAIGPATSSGSLPPDCRAVGIDLSMNMLKRARKRLKAARGAQALLCQADARALPFPTGSFGVILSSYLIDLLPERDIPVVVQEFHRVLRPGGRVVLLTMARQRLGLQMLWTALYRCAPVLVGGCRPLDAALWLRRSGWDIEREETVTQMGFRSQLIVARPRPHASGIMAHSAVLQSHSLAAP